MPTHRSDWDDTKESGTLCCVSNIFEGVSSSGMDADPYVIIRNLLNLILNRKCGANPHAHGLLSYK
jgi:hypothetical protein